MGYHGYAVIIVGVEDSKFQCRNGGFVGVLRVFWGLGLGWTFGMWLMEILVVMGNVWVGTVTL